MGRRWSLALVVIALMVARTGAAAQASSDSRMTVSRSLATVAERELDARSALIRGLAVPGLGHFYAGKPVIGAGYLGATATAVLVGLLSERIEIECLSPLNGGDCPAGMEHSRHERRHLLGRSLLAAGAIAAAGAVHAWIDVRRSSGGSTTDASSGEAGLGVGLLNAELSGDRVRVGLVSLRF